MEAMIYQFSFHYLHSKSLQLQLSIAWIIIHGNVIIIIVQAFDRWMIWADTEENKFYLSS